MIGIIGGSGFYSLLEDMNEIEVNTPYGNPSSKIAVGRIMGREIAFISRHGHDHRFPPHKVPYKANLFAFHKLGIKQIISAAAVGSLKPEIKPGDFLVPDQIANFTYRREETYYENDENSPKQGIFHISFAEPFCKNVREELIKASGTKHKNGTVVVINGPRFSTKTESNHYRSHNWDIINMTIYPECILARELEMCYANISLITDYDTGLKNDKNEKMHEMHQFGLTSVTVEDVLKIFKENSEKLKNIVLKATANMKTEDCSCQHALDGAKLD